MGTPSNIDEYTLKRLCTENGAFVCPVRIILLSHLTNMWNLRSKYSVSPLLNSGNRFSYPWNLLDCCLFYYFFTGLQKKLVELMEKNYTVFLLALLFMPLTFFVMHMLMLTPTLRHFCKWNSNKTHTFCLNSEHSLINRINLIYGMEGTINYIDIWSFPSCVAMHTCGITFVVHNKECM